MRKISDTIARLKRMPHGVAPARAASSRLKPFAETRSNPGQLKAWSHVPESAGPGAPLVVVLHGCTQTAAGYDEASGWSRLADRHGFVLLYPEQQRTNNPNLCFNWFAPDDVTRGQGEVRSIREMVAAVQARHQTDPARVFVTGLSAGGAMTAAMLATYPEVFAGGAVIAGLPYGVARSVPEAFDRMRGQGGKSGSALARLVRDASGHTGAWPTLSVWHGTADQTVDQANASALLDQWRPLHGLAEAPDAVDTVRGYPRRVWRDAKGREVIEEYSIAGLGHGTPLDTSGTAHGERAAPFMLGAGISSTYLIARFWGIVPERAEGRSQPAKAAPAPAQSGVAKTIEDALRTAGLMK